MKKVLLSLMVVVLLLASSATLVMAAPGDVTDSDYLKDLGKAGLAAAHATAKYQNVAKAEADGYVPVSLCIAAPPGVMGIHYANFGLVDDTVDPRTPEILLYVPADGGGVRLVGVEYMVLDEGQSAPVLFGQTFAGPMAHGLGPSHFDLHVWLWEENPSGIFAGFNPNPDLSC